MRGEELVPVFQAALKAPVRLIWTENASVYLSLRRERGLWLLRLHRSFQAAPSEVLSAIERFLRTGSKRHLGPARQHFEGCRRPVPIRGRRESVEPAGDVYHLEEILAEVRAFGPFGGLAPVGITWGARVPPGRVHIRLGSYRAGQRGRPPLIRVHRLLDQSGVPRFAVGHVVHHELVHHYLTHARGAAHGRRHDRAFRELEAGFPHHDSAVRWQRERLPRLMRSGGR